MAKSKKETRTAEKPETEKKRWAFSRQHKVLLGVLFFLFSIALLLSFISYFFYWDSDQSSLSAFGNRQEVVRNWLGKFGAGLAHLFLYQGFGVASFILVRFFFLMGSYLVLDLPVRKLKKTLFWDLYLVVVVSVLFGFFHAYLPELGGVIGFEMNDYIQDYLASTGTMLVLVFALFLFLIFRIKMSPDAIKTFFENRRREIEEDLDSAQETAATQDNAAMADAMPSPVSEAPATEDKKPLLHDDRLNEDVPEEEDEPEMVLRTVSPSPAPPCPIAI